MNWETLNWIDVILGAAVLISALVGICRGFLKEVLSLIAWGVALYAAYTFSDMAAQNYVQKVISDKLISYIAAFGGIFLVVLFAIGLLNLLISQLLKATGLGFLDRFLGLMLGVVRGVFIAALLVFMMSLVVTPQEFKQWRDSELVPYFVPVVDWGLAHLPRSIANRINVKNHPEDFGVLSSHRQADDNTLQLTSESRKNEKDAADNSVGFHLESVQDNRSDKANPPAASREPVLKLESTR